MLPVRFEGNGPQNEEAIDDGNETGINWSGGDALSRRDTDARRKSILDEFVKVTGFHRKHAIRALRKTRASPETAKPPPRSRLYDEAVGTALIILWEAADRMCGKRLKEAIPVLVEAMERYGHLKLGRGSTPSPTGHECRHDGSASTTRSGSRQPRTAEVANQYAVTKQHCRANVRGLE